MSEKIFLLTAIFALSLVCLTGIAVYGNNRLHGFVEDIRNGAASRRFTDEVHNLLSEERLAMAAFLSRPKDDAARRAAREELARLDDSAKRTIAEYEEPFAGSALHALIPPMLSRSWGDCLSAALTMVDGTTDDSDAGNEASELEWLRQRNKLGQYADDVTSMLDRETETNLESVERLARTISAIVIFLCSMSVLMGTILAYVVVAHFAKKLKSIISGVNACANRLEILGDGARHSAAASQNTTTSELSAEAATLSELANDLSTLVYGNEKKTAAPTAVSAEGDSAIDRQFAAWASLPPDLRAALTILARRLDGDKKG